MSFAFLRRFLEDGQTPQVFLRWVPSTTPTMYPGLDLYGYRAIPTMFILAIVAYSFCCKMRRVPIPSLAGCGHSIVNLPGEFEPFPRAQCFCFQCSVNTPS